MSLIELQDVSVDFGNLKAICDATLFVERGEIFVLMGLSGSGKSTLLRCMNGLVKPSSGVVDVAGSRLSNCGFSELKQLRMKTVSMVFQKPALLPWRNVQDNVALGLELQGVSACQRRERVLACLEIVGLSKWADYFPEQLSGGMQQRVGLARALVTQAEILLMDEPFSALDPLIRGQLQQELLRLQTELKKTIVFVSHDLDEALRIGNRIAIMEAGKIVQIGAPSEIISKPVNDYVRRFVGNIEKHCPRCAVN